jgi:abortive infection bacteriophage resistance protein
MLHRSWRAIFFYRTMDEYKTISQLIEILGSRGLKFNDEETGPHVLRTVGHYRLNAFYDAFYVSPKRFDDRVPVHIDDVANLYSFDRRLRLLILGPLEKIEVALRALIAQEMGDSLISSGVAPPITFDLFDKRFYDLAQPGNRARYDISVDSIERSLYANWRRKLSGAERKLPKKELNTRFRAYRSTLTAWEVLQAATFGPLANLFATLRADVAVKIAIYFKLPRHVLTSVFYALKDLRNSCAHHSPIWNWNARTRSFAYLFPRVFAKEAGIEDSNRDLLYSYCAVMHVLLSVLSRGQTTWYRRLKKLINEYNTIYGAKIGFPPDWQTLPFWCVADVWKLAEHGRMRARLSTK